eukprot:8314729-Pyramimonas_sp.AAC.1
MHAKWEDGMDAELHTLTADDWKSRGSRTTKAKPRHWMGELNDGTKVEVKHKLLDRGSPGAIIAVGGSQK